jgi:hypothetical protein
MTVVELETFDVDGGEEDGGRMVNWRQKRVCRSGFEGKDGPRDMTYDPASIGPSYLFVWSPSSVKFLVVFYDLSESPGSKTA